MALKIIVKVNINCSKCKRQILKTVTKLGGIDHITIDGEKGTVTVIGDVDPVDVVTRLRKIKKVAEIMSVGPPKPNEPAKTPAKTPACQTPLNYYNKVEYQYIPVCHSPYESGPMCFIL